jgi:hypothetical protein
MPDSHAKVSVTHVSRIKASFVAKRIGMIP